MSKFTDSMFDRVVEGAREDWSEEERRELRAFLTGKIGVKMLQWMGEGVAVAAGSAFDRMNLATQEGIIEAARLQGERRGIMRAIETALELADYPAQKQESEDG